MRRVRSEARQAARKSVAGDLDLKAMKPEDCGVHLAGGVPAALTRTADTAEARGLVSALAESLEAHHRASGRWKHKRGPAAQERLQRALAGFLGDLLAAPGAGRWGGLVWQSTHNNRFSGGPVSGDTFRDLKAFLVESALVEVFPGYRIPTDEGGGLVSIMTQAARFRATPRLLAVAEGHGVLRGCVDDHFVPSPLAPLPDDAPLIVLKSASVRIGGRKLEGAPMPVPDGPEVRRMNAQLAAIRDFLRGVTIEGGQHRGFVRQFEEGDHPRFAWDRGGRLYSVGGGYQQLKPEQRRSMRLNGEAVVEVDIKASHLTLLHGLTQTPFLPGPDPYAVPGIDREVVKTWVTASLGGRKPLARWSKEHRAKFAKRTDVDLVATFPPKTVYAAVSQRHPILANIPDLGIGWGTLTYVESEAVLATMVALMEAGVPALPVHDSIIVPKSEAGRASSMLSNAFEARAGIRPKLEIIG